MSDQLVAETSTVQHVTVPNTVGSFNTILFYNILILWDHGRVCCPNLCTGRPPTGVMIPDTV